MNIVFVGCGFVFDINSKRRTQACKYYGFRAYDSFDEILADETIDIVVNLTNPGSHFEVSKRAWKNEENIYSEKPITKNFDETGELFDLQKANGVRLYGASCNIYSDTCRTIFKAVKDGVIGKPLVVDAELDDNLIHLSNFESVKSRSGASCPIVEEINEGCTFKHLGYHLVWICGLFRPVISVIAFCDELIEPKTESLLGKVGTPDYSVACLKFANGATARITCSVVAPRDHRMRIIGREGEISTDGYRQYQSPVYLERFSKGSLNARKFRTFGFYPTLGRLFGIGGRKLKLVKHRKLCATEKDKQMHSSFKQRLFEWLRRREVYAQDNLLSIAEMASEVENGKEQYLFPDFILYINELTLLIYGAGPDGIACKPETSFEKFNKLPDDIYLSKVICPHTALNC